MKKTVIKIIIIILSVMIMTGCIKSHTVMTIKNDKSMDFSMEYLLFNTLIENGLDINTILKKDAIENRGFKYEKISKDNYSGVRITKKYDNIDNISNSKGLKVEIEDIFNSSDNADDILFKVNNSLFRDVYTAKFTYDTTSKDKYSDNISSNEDDKDNDEISNIEESSNIDSEENNEGKSKLFNNATDYMAKEMEFTYVVNLPSKSLSNNASSLSNDKKTLTWKLDNDKINEINYSFQILNKKNIAIAGGSIVLLIVIIVVIIVVKKKNILGIKPNELPIHTDFDPSIANKINENNTSNTNPQSNVEPSNSEFSEQKKVEYEFTLPEEKTIEEIKSKAIENPIEKGPLFIKPVVEETVIEETVKSSNVIEIETPEIIDMNEDD